MSELTEPECSDLLEGRRCAVLSIASRGRGPLVAPIWYEFLPSLGFRFVIAGDSAKARRLRVEGRATVCVQQDCDEYRYVVAEGPVTMTPLSREQLLDVWTPTVRRYLGYEGAQRFLDAFDEPDPQLVVLAPARWRTEKFDDVDRES